MRALRVKRESGENPEQSCCRIDLAMLYVWGVDSYRQPLGVCPRRPKRLCPKSKPENLPFPLTQRFHRVWKGLALRSFCVYATIVGSATPPTPSDNLRCGLVFSIRTCIQYSSRPRAGNFSAILRQFFLECTKNSCKKSPRLAKKSLRLVDDSRY